MSRTLLNAITAGLALTSVAVVAPFAHSQGVDHSNIITNADVATLSTDLGQGPLALTRIFSHINGDGETAADFHTAVDGKGPTFSVEKITAYGNTTPLTAIVGGYNPTSWNSGGLVFTPFDAQRTAFIFNLTNSVVQRQHTTAQDGSQTGPGFYQTTSGSNRGPSFGLDIEVLNDLNTGSASNYSYGATTSGTNILGNPTGSSTTSGLVYSDIEVFTFTQAPATPEPGPLVLLASGILGVGLLSRRRNARSPCSQEHPGANA